MHVRLFTNNYDFLVALRLTVQSKLDSLVENSHCLALMMLSKELLTQLVIKGKKQKKQYTITPNTLQKSSNARSFIHFSLLERINTKVAINHHALLRFTSPSGKKLKNAIIDSMTICGENHTAPRR